MLLLRGATGWTISGCLSMSFNTCSSCEEQLSRTRRRCIRVCFNTCSSCEEQLIERDFRVCHVQFQYMLLLRGATFFLHVILTDITSFNTCSSCEEQLVYWRCSIRTDIVSIHAPLARSNNFAVSMSTDSFRFNTCSSCEEQHTTACLSSPARGFNTCSSCEEQLRRFRRRGTTNPRFNTCSSCEEQLGQSGRGGQVGCFNTCSSCEEQPEAPSFHHAETVSIHAPLARSNATTSSALMRGRWFQYMLLLRGATTNSRRISAWRCFNTCSSCEEQLVLIFTNVYLNEMFQYMLLLRGATPGLRGRRRAHRFQYMLLLRGATYKVDNYRFGQDVSIHAPLARSNLDYHLP